MIIRDIICIMEKSQPFVNRGLVFLLFGITTLQRGSHMVYYE